MKMILNKFESEKIISKYLPTAKHQLIKNCKDKVNLKFPLFAKGIAKEIPHAKRAGFLMKSKSPKELNKVIKDFEKKAQKKKIKLDGILLQEEIIGNEFIIGIKKDFTFGHVIMLGIGGSHAEEIRDVSFRLCPITKSEAKKMASDLKNQALLKGINTEKLYSALEIISKLPQKLKDLKELDINPIIINNKDATIVDALLVF
jgi:succinyl-CoA synthetase beta subunit